MYLMMHLRFFVVSVFDLEETDVQAIFFHGTDADELVPVKIGCYSLGVGEKGRDCPEGTRCLTVIQPPIVFDVDVTILSCFILSAEHVPCRHMADTDLVLDLGIDAPGFDDAVEDLPFYRSVKRDHVDFADLRFKLSARLIEEHMDVQYGLVFHLSFSV